MGLTRIVTDSGAELPLQVVEGLDITVVPWHIRLDTETVADGPSLWSTEFYRKMVRRRVLPVALAPTWQEFATTYARLARQTEDIVSIHLGSSFGKVGIAASRAHFGVLGKCRIQLVDSQFVSRAMGNLVVVAARAAQEGATGTEIVRLVHGLIPSCYFAFHVETLDYIERCGLIDHAREASSGLSRSLLMIEDGVVTFLRRSRRIGTPIERLVEFVSEFDSVSDLAVLHTGLGSGGTKLKALLGEQLPEQPFEEHIYGPVLSSLIGPVALGVVVFGR